MYIKYAVTCRYYNGGTGTEKVDTHEEVQEIRDECDMHGAIVVSVIEETYNDDGKMISKRHSY